MHAALQAQQPVAEAACVRSGSGEKGAAALGAVQHAAEATCDGSAVRGRRFVKRSGTCYAGV